MDKLKLGLAVLIAATVLSSCEESGSDELIEALKKTPAKPPDGKTATNIVVTFKNGWEDAARTDLLDDDYTSFIIHKELEPSTVNAVVDTEEKIAYDAVYTVWKEINEKWVQYEKEREEALNSGGTPPPPQ
jgi:hypothetical protein